MRRWKDEKMRRWEDEKMGRWEDGKMRGWEDGNPAKETCLLKRDCLKHSMKVS